MLVIPIQAGGQRYAVRATTVQRVIPVPCIVRLAGGPEALIGVLLYRQISVPVIDLGLLLAATPCRERLSSRILLFAQGGDADQAPALGLLAEEVGLAAEALPNGSSPPHAPAAEPGLLGESVLIEGRLVHLLNWQALMTPELLSAASPA